MKKLWGQLFGNSKAEIETESISAETLNTEYQAFRDNKKQFNEYEFWIFKEDSQESLNFLKQADPQKIAFTILNKLEERQHSINNNSDIIGTLKYLHKNAPKSYKAIASILKEFEQSKNLGFGNVTHYLNLKIEEPRANIRRP